MPVLADRFTEIFREEHRRVRDGLLDLLEAFKDRNLPRARALLGQIAADTGPHFRYEEETMYPALIEVFGDEYIGKLFGDHDRAIGIAQRLVELAGQTQLNETDTAYAVKLIRRVLPHVSDCDGLSIMVETLPAERVQRILETRERSLQEGLDLLAWASRLRQRPIVRPA